MIDEDLTLQLYGYTSDSLSKGSHKPIVRVCDKCGQISEILFYNYNKVKNSNLCKSCSMKDDLNPFWKPKLIKICHQCHEEFKTFLSKKDKKFCSRECMGKWMSENLINKNAHNWKGGLSFENYPQEFNNQLKEQIRNQYDNCDYISGIPDYICNILNNKIWQLDIHHIDYNKQNNNENNLIPLCESNHIRTNANRLFWNKLFIYAIKYNKEYYKGNSNEISNNIFNSRYKF